MQINSIYANCIYKLRVFAFWFRFCYLFMFVCAHSCKISMKSSVNLYKFVLICLTKLFWAPGRKPIPLCIYVNLKCYYQNCLIILLALYRLKMSHTMIPYLVSLGNTMKIVEISSRSYFWFLFFFIYIYSVTKKMLSV